MVLRPLGNGGEPLRFYFVGNFHFTLSAPSVKTGRFFLTELLISFDNAFVFR